MANEVIHVNPNRQVSGYSSSLNSRQIRHITAVAEVTKAGIDEIGRIGATASIEAARSVKAIQQYEYSCTLSAQGQQAMAQLKRNSCAQIEQITQEASSRIISLINNLPPDIANTLWDDLSDLIRR